MEIPLLAGRDIEIAFTGIRRGEKLSEDLWERGTHFQPTAHSEIFRSREDEEVDGQRLTQAIEQLERLAHQGEVETIIRVLDEVIPSAAVRSTPPPDITSII